MKKFIKRLLYFLLPIIILAYPLDRLISKTLSTSNAFDGVYEPLYDIYNSEIKADIAIYGSSRARVQIDPNILEDSFNLTTYNFGIDGQNFWIQYLRHIELLKFNKKPKHIILSLDVQTLSRRGDLYLYEQYLPFLLYNKEVKAYTDMYKGFNVFDYYIPLIRYMGEWDVLNDFLGIFFKFKDNTRHRSQGYAPMYKPWDERFKKNDERFSDIKIEINKDSEEIFERFITECKQNNIQLILIYSPEYAKAQQRIKNRTEIINLYKHLSQKHDLLYLDYSKDKICDDKNLFFDPTHLNEEGARIFSKKLASDLKQIL